MRSVQNFIDEIGDIDMHKITRAHGRAFYNWWGERITPKDEKKDLNPNSANHDIGNLRTLFRVYWEYEGDESRSNPFKKLTYTESSYKDIPSFSDKWVREKIMKPGMFDKLKNETGLLVLALIETGFCLAGRASPAFHLDDQSFIATIIRVGDLTYICVGGEI